MLAKFQGRKIAEKSEVDATPLFIFLCWLYYEKTTDTDWLSEFWPYLVSALLWYEKYGDLDGDYFLEYQKKNPAGLSHQGWKDGLLAYLNVKGPVELVEVQGYYYACRFVRRFLSGLLLKETVLSESLKKRATKLKQRFIKHVWLAEDRFFAWVMTKNIKK